MSAAAQLSRRMARHLSPTLVERAKLFILHTLGVLAGAAGAPGIPQVDGMLARWNGNGRSTGLIGGWRGAPDGAALALVRKGVTAGGAERRLVQHDAAL